MIKIARLCFGLCALVLVGFAADFQIGDQVQLAAQHPSGVPVRDQPADTQYYRWPDRTEAVVVLSQGNYVQVETSAKRGWIHQKYLTRIAAPTDEGVEIPTITVGAWNLEHLHDGASRGFPELVGTSALPPRTPGDYTKIADAIRDQLGTAVVLLSEIAGVPGQRTSVELDRLKGLLGPTWKYAIGSSGGINGGQRVAILYDDARVEALSIDELPVPREEVQGDDIFDRDPLVGYFRVRRAGAPGNDFLAVVLHLASGQGNVANHNRAMQRFREDLHAYCQSKPALRQEKDILVGGDLNASRYDNKREDFWDGYDASGYKFTTLASEDGNDYLATRLRGTPLFPGSQIDYLLASEQLKGALVLPVATVHHELAASGDFLAFRRNYSDHFPITVSIFVANDID